MWLKIKDCVNETIDIQDDKILRIKHLEKDQYRVAIEGGKVLQIDKAEYAKLAKELGIKAEAAPKKPAKPKPKDK